MSFSLYLYSSLFFYCIQCIYLLYCVVVLMFADVLLVQNLDKTSQPPGNEDDDIDDDDVDDGNSNDGSVAIKIMIVMRIVIIFFKFNLEVLPRLVSRRF